MGQCPYAKGPTLKLMFLSIRWGYSMAFESPGIQHSNKIDASLQASTVNEKMGPCFLGWYRDPSDPVNNYHIWKSLFDTGIDFCDLGVSYNSIGSMKKL